MIYHDTPWFSYRLLIWSGYAMLAWPMIPVYSVPIPWWKSSKEGRQKMLCGWSFLDIFVKHVTCVLSHSRRDKIDYYCSMLLVSISRVDVTKKYIIYWFEIILFHTSKRDCSLVTYAVVFLIIFELSKVQSVEMILTIMSNPVESKQFKKKGSQLWLCSEKRSTILPAQIIVCHECVRWH